MKLELKHIAPYLPYELKMKHYENNRIGILQGVSTNTLGQPYSLCVNTNWCNYFVYKPILRPLSDLTKEIEVNGKKFVPIDVIGEDFDLNICDCDYVSDWSERGDNFLDYVNEFIEQKHGNHHLNFLPFGFIQKLIEWHFDIFQLIPQKLAIDINTLNE